jgi:PhnB protein
MTPYLAFPGTCEEAFTAYASLFGGKIESLNRYEGSPIEGQVPADFKRKIMHAAMSSPLGTLMGSDREHALPDGSRISISITPKAEDSRRIFEALATGGTVGMPLQDVFWGGKFGMVTDRYGIDWFVSVDP